jgi:hypothetical protein
MANGKCEVCGTYGLLEKHHVLGRVGDEKHEPQNIIRLCRMCHFLWHNHRTEALEDRIYAVMKETHGDKFPIMVNGKPYKTKWLVNAEERAKIYNGGGLSWEKD